MNVYAILTYSFIGNCLTGLYYLHIKFESTNWNR